MIKSFMTESGLIDYINKLEPYDKDSFIIELIDYINYGNYWYLYNKSRIIEMIYETNDEKAMIIGIERLAQEAMVIGKPKFMNVSLRIDHSESEIINLYNKYLDIVYRNTFYFIKIYTISTMFDTMAFNCSFFPDVDGIITGVYNGRHKGYSRSELLKKYVNIILNINSTFDSEWVSLRKFDLYKLQK
jgi:hypothetical protein